MFLLYSSSKRFGAINYTNYWTKSSTIAPINRVFGVQIYQKWILHLGTG
jgi:hypothetical protein